MLHINKRTSIMDTFFFKLRMLSSAMDLEQLGYEHGSISTMAIYALWDTNEGRKPLERLQGLINEIYKARRAYLKGNAPF